MTSSTINPAVPAQGAALSSAAIRANFQAAVNDINSLWNSFTTAPVFNSITGGVSPFNIVGYHPSSGAGGAMTVIAGSGSTGGGLLTLQGGSGLLTSNGGGIAITGGSGGVGAPSGNQDGGDITLTGGVPHGAGATGKVVLSGSALKVGASQTAANTSVATVLGSVGPAGSHTTVQEWLVVQNSSGTARYIPCF